MILPHRERRTLMSDFLLPIERRARFFEGPKGQEQFEQYLKENPEFASEWEEQTDKHKDQFKGANTKIQPGDRFKDQYGVWRVSGPARGTQSMWEVYLESRGRGHAKVVDGSELLRFFEKVAADQSVKAAMRELEESLESFEEAMWAKGEEVPLEKLPEELQENVKNPPPEVQALKEKMVEKSRERLSKEGALRPGKMFVIVDTSVPGGKWVDEIIYDSASEADRVAEKLMARGKEVQVLDAVWYAPSEARLKALGMRSAASELSDRSKTPLSPASQKMASEQMLRRAFVPDGKGQLVWEGGVRTASGMRYADYLQSWWDDIEESTKKAVSRMDGAGKLTPVVKNSDYHFWKIQGSDPMGEGVDYLFEVDVRPDFQRGYISLKGRYSAGRMKLFELSMDVGLNATANSIGDSVVELLGRLIDRSA
jgi:hypothetical protein